MNNILHKLTSFTLMTIMFAGGMTIAIPGETPVAIAQTGMLSVSVTAAPDNSFGGSQVIEIVVDDPSRSETGTGISRPDVTIDGNTVPMIQADTGKWYGYVASDVRDAADASNLLTDANILDSTPTPARPADQTDLTTIHTFDFTDDSDIDVVLGDETITLHYAEDLDDLATVSVDRTGVPDRAHVHVTISDFRLNLDPTAADVWYVNASSSSATYGTTEGTNTIDSNALTAITALDINWNTLFGGNGGEFAITGSTAVVSDIDVTGDGIVDGITTDASDNIVRFEETGANTGVFTSEDDDDNSNIVADGDENDDFTIEYADDSVQVFIESFDSTLETISDGTWNSGNSLTVRLSDENLNTNTLTDQDMEIGDDDLPILMFGDPITLATVTIEPVVDETDPIALGDRLTIDKDTHVGKLMKSTAFAADNDYTFTITLEPDQLSRLQDGTLNNYIHYSSDLDAATNAYTADLTAEPDTLTTPTAVENGARIVVHSNADGIFNITFTPLALPDDTPLTQAAIDNNNAIRSAVDNAASGTNVAGVKTAVATTETAPAEFRADVADIDDDADLDDAKAAVERIALEHIVTHDFTIAADIFTFGDGVNNAIYRALLEETDSGSGVFEATVEYQMLNQRTVNDAATHQKVDAVGNELAMILDTGYTGTDAPEIDYAGDNASEDAPTNTGEVALDSETYRVSDEVTITLTDADLNTDSGAKEIYQITDTTEADLVTLEIAGSACLDDISEVSLRETADDSGVFEGSFDVPVECGDTKTTGESISVTYIDFRDDNGKDSEWSDSATIRADTGSVSLDRSVYPIPTAADVDDNIEATKVTITISVDDSDENTSSSSREKITGVTVKLEGDDILTGIEELEETDSDSGIFETTVELDSTANGYDDIEQGDIITATYTDKSDASGNENTVSDSATFDLRNAVLQSDKSVYVIGQDALITLIEPDLNLDSSTVDSVDLARITWDSDAADTDLKNGDFGAVPQSLRETGDNTGIFQVVITIPSELSDDDVSDDETLERGESITLTYNDRSPSGANTVGDDDRDVELNIKTSDFGATVELDQNVYTWTDKVFITVVASDYNFDSNIVDEIGSEDKGEITVRTRGADLEQYRLAETGPDTGVFTGELVLTGQDGEIDDGPSGLTTPSDGAGPTNGLLEAKSSDGLSVSFDFSDGQAPIVASALIRWNIGEVQWLEASYAATGSGIARVIDPDMNINPDAVDNLDLVVYSETFLGGIDLTVTETQESSGIFEGTVEFDPETASQGHRLQVTEGDIITAAYDDVTTPDGDDLEITATTLIGSIVPPLERAPASNPAIVDAFGNSLASVSVDQQVQITADLTSGQDRDQDFAYLVQIQNEDGVTIALSWITGTLGAGATFSPSQSWTPSETGSYTATIFVWESVSNPTALSPQLSITIDVV